MAVVEVEASPAPQLGGAPPSSGATSPGKQVADVVAPLPAHGISGAANWDDAEAMGEGFEVDDYF